MKIQTFLETDHDEQSSQVIGTPMPRLALAQLSMSKDIHENVRKTIGAMESAVRRGADLIMFPEVQLSPFFPQYPDFDAAPYLIDVDHEIVQRLRQECKRLTLNCALNLYLSEDKKAFDASILIDKNGEILGISKMVHVTQAPHFYEQNYYAPSKEGFVVRETETGKVGTVICFDRHFPESIRNCTLQGADIILVPTVNIYGEPLDMFEWEMRVAAFHNSVYIAMCNRVGTEGDVRFCGRSIVVDPEGNIVSRAGDQEEVLCVELDLNVVTDARKDNKYLELFRPENFQLPG